ncbi:MAG: ABC transporter permease subunit [Verrucomicrobiota bacterium]
MTSAFFIQLRRELGAIFNSPMAYVIFLCYTLIIGYIFYTNIQEMEIAPRFSAFQIFFSSWFWICMFVVVPLITMRTYSDEYKTGTIELLLTAPVGDWDVVMSKFFATFVFYITLWAPTATYMFVFQWVSGGQLSLKVPELMLCYLLVCILGSFFVSFGMFTSSLTKNQALSAFLTFCGMLTLFFIGLMSLRMPDSKFTPFIEYISCIQHMSNFIFGIFDSRPLVFYLSGTALFLALTQRVMAVKKLKS